MKYLDNDFKFKKCTLRDLDSICEIQEVTFKNLENSELLRRNSREILTSCLKEPHYTLGAYHDDKLIAFAILYDGKETDENIGNDINIPTGKLNSVINLKLVIVLPEYRGNKLQNKLISQLEKVAKEKGKAIICATISPLNSYSSNNFKTAGYVFYANKTKYNGMNRDIYYKRLM